MTKKIKIHGLLRLTRSYNLLMILLTQYLIYIFLLNGGSFELTYILQPSFFLLCLSTISIAAAGYIINDYHDVKIDMINKPARVVVGSVINRRIALLLYIILGTAGVAIGFLLSWQIGVINLLAAGLLWLYSIKLKKVAFWGNFSISVLTAISVLIIYVWNPGEANLALLVYAWFAFILTLIREIIKDMEDVKGDRLYGCKTLPIIWGISGTIKFLTFLCLIVVATLFCSFFFAPSLIMKLFAIVILLEMIILAYKIRNTDTIRGFRRLGQFCKMVMLTGILAILFL